MSKPVIEKPFWLIPPWQVLFDLIRIHKIRPWDVNVTHVLSSFLNKMKEKGYVDFAVSGTALLSACIVLRLQSELIMKLQEPPKPPVVKPTEHIPPPIQLPFRYEHTSTTLDHLIEVLEDAMQSEAIERPQKLSPIMPPPPEFFREYDNFFMEIESKIDEFYEKLKRSSMGKMVAFSKITEDLDRQETIRTFLLLLFLTAEKRIRLLQEEEFGEIYVTFTLEPDTNGSNLTV
ncbi:MAG: hypothetical protein ABIH76_01830 [Candidatus Bathyarchaeota archaeon]